MIKNSLTALFLCVLTHASLAQNLIANGSFEQSTNWNNLAGDGGSAVYTYLTTDATEGTRSLKVDVTTLGTNAWSIQSIHSGWTAVSGTPYTLSFYAKSAVSGASLKVVDQNTTYNEKSFMLTDAWKKYEWTFTPTETSLQLKFNYLSTGIYFLDDVQILAPGSGGPLTLTLNKATLYQQMTGFGGAITWYADRVTSSAKQAEITQLLFSDLGTDIIRLKNWYYPAGYPAVKSPATMETNWFKPHFDATNQLYTIAKQNNANIDVLLSSWGPPSALKSNDNLNEGTLKKNPNGQFMYPEFGQFWADILDNITFTPEYISIQNEPGFTTPDWASCSFRPVETADIAGYDKAFDAVYDQIKTRTVVPKMIGPETENIGGALWDNSLNTFREFATPIKNKAALAAYAFHMYNYYGSPGSLDPAPLNMIKNEFSNAPNFMTEFSSDNFDWLQTGDAIQDALIQANTSAYIYWEMMWDETSTHALMTVDASGNYTIGNHYYTIKHFAKHIDKGYTRLALTGNNALTKSSAFINPAGTQITIVSVNTSTAAQDITLGFGSTAVSGVTAFQSVSGNFYQNKGAVDVTQNITLPAKSITTFIVTLTNSCAVATISNTTPATFCAGGSVVLTANSGSSYKWFNGSTQVGTGQSYTASTAGNYTVEVTDANNCHSTSAPKVVTVIAPANCPTTPTLQSAGTEAIQVVPNPSSDRFTLTLEQTSDVQIVSAEGKVVEVFHNVNNLSFGTGYAKGVYLVQVTNGTTKETLRVVKQ